MGGSSAQQEHLESSAAHIKSLLHPFISSAHVGCRKPERRIYDVAVQRMGDALGDRGTLRPEEILFLDDIGANLKGAADVGMRTLKVWIRRVRSGSWERVTGLDLRGDGGGEGGGKGAKL